MMHHVALAAAKELPLQAVRQTYSCTWCTPESSPSASECVGVESFVAAELPEDEVKLIVSGIGVVFVVLIRDGEAFVERNLRLLEALGKRFRSFRVVYVENDSRDATRSILSSLSASFLIGKTLNRVARHPSRGLCPSTRNKRDVKKRNCRNRTRFLGSLRQHALELAIHELATAPWEYLVALDLDFLAFPALDFLHAVALAAKRNVSAVMGNSRYRDGGALFVGYDTALVVRPALAKVAVRRGCSPSVMSAFGGVAIYSAAAILSGGASYERDALETDDNEHLAFHRGIDAHSKRTGAPIYVESRLRPIYYWGEPSHAKAWSSAKRAVAARLGTFEGLSPALARRRSCDDLAISRIYPLPAVDDTDAVAVYGAMVQSGCTPKRKPHEPHPWDSHLDTPATGPLSEIQRRAWVCNASCVSHGTCTRLAELQSLGGDGCIRT